MSGAEPANAERVVVWSAGRRDAAITKETLARDGVDAIVCSTVEDVCARIREGAAALLVTEDVLTRDACQALCALLDAQPPWSDLPILAFADPRDGLRARTDPIRSLGNVSLLERPVRVRSMLAAVQSALRSRRRQYQARRAIASRDEFLAMLGHELRNPLGAIRFAVELSAQNGGHPTTRQFEILDRQSRHLVRLVDDLLDVARVTHGKVVLREEPVDLVDLLRVLVAGADPAARAQGLVTTLSAPSSAVEVQGDRHRLEQIFGNLMTNAVKYTPRGGSISVEVAATGADVVVRVRDTGIGIAPEMLPHVFDIFSQADRTLDRAQGGLGLGLSVVRGLVQLHRGTVEAHSAGVGHGTEVVVRLSRLRQRTSDVVPSGQAPRGMPAPPSARRESGQRVVAVEDNEDMREMLAELLDLGGHDHELAADGPEGLARILAFRPDVAFVDVGLPGFDGFEVARRARAAGCSAHLVAVTGYGRAEDQARALDAGFDEHLTKPVNLAQIEAVMRRSRAAERKTG